MDSWEVWYLSWVSHRKTCIGNPVFQFLAFQLVRNERSFSKTIESFEGSLRMLMNQVSKSWIKQLGIRRNILEYILWTLASFWADMKIAVNRITHCITLSTELRLHSQVILRCLIMTASSITKLAGEQSINMKLNEKTFWSKHISRSKTLQIKSFQVLLYLAQQWSGSIKCLNYNLKLHFNG